MDALTVDVFAFQEEEVTDNQKLDVIGEALNVLVGAFLASFLGADALFEIGLPEFGEGSPPTSKLNYHTFKLEDHRFQVCLKLSEVID